MTYTLILTIVRSLLHHPNPKARRNSTLARAVAFAPETKAYIPSVPPIIEDISPHWLALEKQIGASCMRQEAHDALALQQRYSTRWGKEAQDWLALRREYIEMRELV